MKWISVLMTSLTVGAVLTACGPAPTASSTEPSTAESSVPASDNMESPAERTETTFKYVGQTQDVAPANFTGGPDGKADYQFTLQHTFEGEVTLKEITISRVENGQPNGIAGWTTNSQRQYWILKVQSGGADVNGTARVPNLGTTFSGPVTFELFGSDAEGFDLVTPGTEYQLLMSYTDASGSDQELVQRVTLP